MDSILRDSDSIINTRHTNPNVNLNGLTLLTAAVFIVGEMSGTGVLSLPKALLQSGWSGLAVILISCVLSAYCGIRLSSCWMIILNKNESMRQGIRDPYPTIAYEAAGKIGRYLVLVVSYLQLFGVAVIFILIAGHNFRSVLETLIPSLHFCDWTIILIVLMSPIAMLGTPKDFWPIAVGAMIFTAVACLLIFIKSMRQITTPLPSTDVHVTFE